MKRKKFVCRSVNSIDVAQRVDDGFINATAMCAAHGKDLSQWFRTKDTLELFMELAHDLGLSFNPVDLQDLDVSRLSASKFAEIFPGLVFFKRGAPGTGGGTWLHPDLALQLAQWCNKRFAIQVSRWIREWMTAHRNPLTPGQEYRVESRDYLKDKARKELVGQVKSYLVTVRRYVEGYREGYFREVHNAINKAITNETASDMRLRISRQLSREVKQNELIRDYFPSEYLNLYIAICNVVANLIRQGNDPLEAVEIAKGLALPHDYVPMPINIFEESTRALKMRQVHLRSLPA